MKIEQLKYVLELERCKSINRASRKLFISQQSLSYQINSLEKELGFKILERYTNGSTFTRKGLLFVDFCRKVLQEWDDFQEHVRTDQSEYEEQILQGELIVYTNKTFATFILPEYLGTFLVLHPGIHVKTVLTDNNDVDKIDFDNNFVWLADFPKDENLQRKFLDERFEFSTLFSGRYLWVYYTKGKVPKQRTIQMKNLFHHPLIYFGLNEPEDNKETVLTACVKKYSNELLHFSGSTDSYAAWIDMIAAGRGSGFMYNRIWKKLEKMYFKKMSNVAIVTINENLEIVSGCVTRKNSPTDIERTFVNFLLENFNEDECFTRN